MSKHTPGPWFVEQDAQTPIYVSPVDRHEQIAICNVMVIDEDPEDDSGEWFNGEQTKANANLIAAAPDLLEALEALVSINEAHNKSIAAITGQPANWKDRYLDAARKAIARAKGEK